MLNSNKDTPFELFFKRKLSGDFQINFEKERLFSLFFSAYNFAENFTMIETKSPIGWYFKETLECYTAGIRLFLAHNALELVVAFCEKSKASIFIKCPTHSNLLEFSREFLKEKPTAKSESYSTIILNALDRKIAKENFIAFENNEKDNLLILAHVLRTMIAHGFFVSAGSKDFLKKNTKICNELADLVLAKSKEIFAEWVENNLPK